MLSRETLSRIRSRSRPRPARYSGIEPGAYGLGSMDSTSRIGTYNSPRSIPTYAGPEVDSSTHAAPRPGLLRRNHRRGLGETLRSGVDGGSSAPVWRVAERRAGLPHHVKPPGARPRTRAARGQVCRFWFDGAPRRGCVVNLGERFDTAVRGEAEVRRGLEQCVAFLASRRWPLIEVARALSGSSTPGATASPRTPATRGCCTPRSTASSGRSCGPGRSSTSTNTTATRSLRPQPSGDGSSGNTGA